MPAAPSVFGKDVSCTAGLSSGVLVSGLRLVAEAAYRRLTTSRGALRGGPDEQSYGIDLLDFVGAQAIAAAALPGQIRTELLKDERINDVQVDITTTITGPATELTIQITCTTDEGPFDLTVAVNDVSVELLDLTTG